MFTVWFNYATARARKRPSTASLANGAAGEIDEENLSVCARNLRLCHDAYLTRFFLLVVVDVLSKKERLFGAVWRARLVSLQTLLLFLCFSSSLAQTCVRSSLAQTCVRRICGSHASCLNGTCMRCVPTRARACLCVCPRNS